MLSSRLVTAFLALGSFLVCDPARAAGSDRMENHQAQLADPDATASVTLDALSVKALGVDKPWDPHVCTGCDRNNGSPFDKKVRLGAHVR